MSDINDFIAKQEVYVVTQWARDSEGRFPTDFEPAPLAEANVLSSRWQSPPQVNGSYHKPVLDIDMQAYLVPSSTEGHFHLMIDKLLTEDQYHKLLNVLAEVGIIQPGFVAAARARKMTLVRLPWIKK